MDDAELRWKLFQAAKQQNWKEYYQIRERLWKVVPPLPPLPERDLFKVHTRCLKCEQVAMCEDCLVALGGSQVAE